LPASKDQSRKLRTCHCMVSPPLIWDISKGMLFQISIPILPPCWFDLYVVVVTHIYRGFTRSAQ
jgi:hypothetical protein